MVACGFVKASAEDLQQAVNNADYLFRAALCPNKTWQLLNAVNKKLYNEEKAQLIKKQAKRSPAKTVQMKTFWFIRKSVLLALFKSHVTHETRNIMLMSLEPAFPLSELRFFRPLGKGRQSGIFLF